MLKFLKKNRFTIAAAATGLVLIAIIIGFHSIDSAKNAEVTEYIESLGWQIEPNSLEISHMRIPSTFDPVFEHYNERQKEAGFDLTAYKGARAVRYSYIILNHTHSESATVRANAIVVNRKIVAADVSSTAGGGFMHAITDTDFIVR